MRIGCNQVIETEVLNSSGNYETQVTGCEKYIYLRDLEGRRTSEGVLFGDFGASWRLNRDRPVSDLIVGRLPKTLLLMGVALTISFLLGVPLGIISAVRQYSKLDYAVTILRLFRLRHAHVLLRAAADHALLDPAQGRADTVPAAGQLRGSTQLYIPWLGTTTAGSTLDRGLHLILPGSRALPGVCCRLEPLRACQYAGRTAPGLRAHGAAARQGSVRARSSPSMPCATP